MAILDLLLFCFPATPSARTLRGRYPEGGHCKAEAAAQPQPGLNSHLQAGHHLRGPARQVG